MSGNLIWFAVLLVSLTIVGILILSFMVQKYYWGSRGTPPPSKEERRRLREESERAARENKQD